MPRAAGRTPGNNLTTPGPSPAPSGGIFFGLLFFMPLLGAAGGALGGKMADVGVDRVNVGLQNGHAELIQSNLDGEQETKLREVRAG
ncbi:hypothetical protein [Streptomyces narbonensis]|uniref:hypothetical protein n=2 Tax=Streptomyces narbonensis TaxID=67333 RepID=UPI0016723FD5|nr:hypothetical protein [Streptomyces narbonensis]